MTRELIVAKLQAEKEVIQAEVSSTVTMIEARYREAMAEINEVATKEKFEQTKKFDELIGEKQAEFNVKMELFQAKIELELRDYPAPEAAPEAPVEEPTE